MLLLLLLLLLLSLSLGVAKGCIQAYPQSKHPGPACFAHNSSSLSRTRHEETVMSQLHKLGYLSESDISTPSAVVALSVSPKGNPIF